MPRHRDAGWSVRIRQGIRAAVVLLVGHAVAVGAAGLTEVTAFGPNPGNLRMWAYVPEELPASAPLVVALHGCGQRAADYDDETGWTRYAERYGFALLLPEQKQGLYFGNHPLGCFNWYYRGDQGRDGGEVLSIIAMIGRMIEDYDIDPHLVYVTGLSAGGAMTAALLAAWPERFAGGAIIAGVPVGCSRVPDYVPQWAVSYWSFWLGYTDPLRCLKPGVDRSPGQWGDRVRGGRGRVPTAWPIVSIWQGTADETVVPRNGIELVEQWTDVHGVDARHFEQEAVDGHRHHVYENGEGRPVVEVYWVQGLGHGMPIDPPLAGTPPGEQPEHCGTPADYILPAGICASYHIARFWGLASP